jgi:hypothetical protein
MRVIWIILLLLMVSHQSNQKNTGIITSCDDAVFTALQNTSNILIPDKKKLSKDVKSAWFNLIFEINKINSIQNYLFLIDDLERVASLRYQTGDIDLLQKTMLVSNVTEARCDLTESQIQTELIKNQLKRLLYSDSEIIPEDSMLTMYEIARHADGEAGSDDLPDSIFLNDKLNGSYQEFILNKTIESLKLSLDKYFTKIRFYQDTGLVDAGLSLQISHVQFQYEEIDYLEYIDKLKEIYKIKLKFLETLNNYNQTAIQLEYYEY